MPKYRRIISNENSKRQSYQIVFGALILVIFILIVSLIIGCSLSKIDFLKEIISNLKIIPYLLCFTALLLLIIFILTFRHREQISKLDIEDMSKEQKKLSKRVRKLFNDKQITDVLKLSNSTRYGEEMPNLYVYVDEDCTSGFVAIENIANFEKMDKEKYEQKVSGVFNGKLKRFAVVSSDLSVNDTYMKFYFEDTETSYRIYIEQNQIDTNLIESDSNAIRLAHDLVWHADETPHLSIIARTRAGKSVFAGDYLCRLMKLQNWTVEYNSAKFDRYVKEFSGKSEVTEIVERAEYWVGVMKRRLDEINSAGKDKYLELENMNNVAVIFDEIGNLNAGLEQKNLKAFKSRWEVAINKLSSTGASAGIHVIAISQFATREGFLPMFARTNCTDAVIMLGGAADSADERRHLMPGFADLPKRNYEKGQGLAKIAGSGHKWEKPHFYETPWFL